MNVSKWYTRVIGILFLLVAVTLVTDYMRNGFTHETFHKILHVAIGVLVVAYGWSRKTFWLKFCLVNGAFFTCVALAGWVYPDLGGLDAFNFLDTVLHTIVGLSGLASYFITKSRS